MTIDRHCGGNTTFEDIPEAKSRSVGVLLSFALIWTPAMQ